MNFCFKKESRLLTKSDFQHLRTGSSFFAADNLLFFVKENQLNRTRIGIAISKKYGKAIKRNRAKRIIREVFRTHNNIPEYLDILIVPNLKKIKRNKVNYTQFESCIALTFSDALNCRFNL